MSTSNRLGRSPAGLALGALVVLTCSAVTARGESSPPEEPTPGTSDKAVPDTNSAQSTASSNAALPPGPESSAADVSGVLVPEVEPPRSPARHLLVVPRLAVTAVAVPVQAGLTLVEDHHVREHLLDLFFDDTRTFGVYPTVTLETRLMPGFGARLVHKNLFGHGGRLRLGGDYGGESRFRVEGG